MTITPPMPPHPLPLSPRGEGSLSHVPCPVCGCACDDLTVTADGERIVSAERACSLAEPWLLAQRSVSTAEPLEPKLAAAAAILRASRAPLIYGLERTTTDGIRAAIALADKLGATIDTPGSLSHAATMAMQNVGLSTCTLGEVKQRADLVIFWGADPAATHPRFVERYCPSREGRTVISVDDGDWETLQTLRLLVRGISIEATDALRELARTMLAARFGVIVFGEGMLQSPLPHRTLEALFQLVIDLNEGRRFYAMPLRPGTSGAESVLTWQTGYPFGVDFSAGYPRHNPGETTAEEKLARGEVDACVLVGSACANELSEAARAHLRTIPVIALDPPGEACPVSAAVMFEVAVPGIHCAGSVHRLDDVMLPMRALLPSALPTDAEVLEALLKRISLEHGL